MTASWYWRSPNGARRLSNTEPQMSYFELKTPRDMLEKAKREHGRLVDRFDIDNVFNFFVTAHHITDYVCPGEYRFYPQALKDLLNEPDMVATADLCDKGKHLVLARFRANRPRDPIATVESAGEYNTAPYNALPYNASAETWKLTCGAGTFDIELLANRIIPRWEKYFADNGL
jgi:hypothetical protein